MSSFASWEQKFILHSRNVLHGRDCIVFELKAGCAASEGFTAQDAETHLPTHLKSSVFAVILTILSGRPKGILLVYRRPTICHQNHLNVSNGQQPQCLDSRVSSGWTADAVCADFVAKRHEFGEPLHLKDAPEWVSARLSELKPITKKVRPLFRPGVTLSCTFDHLFPVGLWTVVLSRTIRLSIPLEYDFSHCVFDYLDRGGDPSQSLI